MKKKTQVAIIMAITPMQIQSMEMNLSLDRWGTEQVIERCGDLCSRNEYVEYSGIQQYAEATINKVCLNHKKLMGRTAPLDLTLVFEPKKGYTLKLGERSLADLNSNKVRLKIYLWNVILEDLDYLFYNSRSIVYIGIKGVKGNFHSMTRMCSGCIRIKDIDFENLNTSNVATMDYAFHDCTALGKMDLNSLDTSKVRTMKGMFANCESLKDLSIDKIDSSRVQNLDSTFLNCYSLDYLNLKNFDAKNLQTTKQMCAGCVNLGKIDLWESGNSNMQGMFANCYSLQELDLSKFKVSVKTNTDDFIRNCEELKLIKYHPASKAKMKYSQKQCEGLKCLNKKRYRNSNVDFELWDAENFEIEDRESENDQVEDRKELESDSDEV